MLPVGYQTRLPLYLPARSSLWRWRPGIFVFVFTPPHPGSPQTRRMDGFPGPVTRDGFPGPQRRISPHPSASGGPRVLTLRATGRRSPFLTLPFGLSTAPAVFTVMMRPILAWCRRQGFPLHAYIDDWLLRHHIRLGVLHNKHTVMDLRGGLGHDLPGSRLVPAQLFQLRGAWVNLREFLVPRRTTGLWPGGTCS